MTTQQLKDPFSGLAPNLIPTPPASMPEPPGVGDAMQALSPFSKVQDIDSIISGLTLNRELKLFIPQDIKERFSQYEFRVINDTPTEIAHAKRQYFEVVDDPEAVALFSGLVSGSTKDGRITKPVLVARDKRVGKKLANLKRQALQQQYAAMDPKNRSFNSAHAETQSVVNAGVTSGKFSGDFWRIKLAPE
ncbi:hypothetical protein [Bradyrhizobium liaoningense]|uniref:hypothetical protein n=1 Tax=Bradyrhizobium liaoningense TaxID=43992 RepID=UPI001BA5899F|nr:hypothetical protein [Bradyrhizobium liaoningense]MBR0712690.1 hypothetical protein [Bradyrhizobium liaoningense]